MIDETWQEPTSEAEPAPEAEPGAITEEPTPRRPGRRLLWAVAAVVVAFLAGFGWQYYRAATFQDRLEQAERMLAVERLRLELAQAAMAAQSGEFERARRSMSDFFTTAQNRLPELSPAARRAVEGMLARRDDVITGLSRGNPEYADVLLDMHEGFRTALGEGDAPAPATEEAAEPRP